MKKTFLRLFNSTVAKIALTICCLNSITVFSMPRSALFMPSISLTGTGMNLSYQLGQLNANLTQTQGTTFVVTNLNDSGAGSLRQAIADANANFGHDTIVFQLGSVVTTNIASIQDQTFSNEYGKIINLTSGELLINDSVTINGPGAKYLMISGQNASRVFNISSARTRINVNLNRMTVSFAKLLESLGVRAEGGGIYSSNSNLSIFDSALTDNEAAIGGGIYAENGVLNIVRSTVSNNSATDGSAIAAGNANTEVNITNSLVSNNTAPAQRTGIRSFYFMTIINSTVTGNDSGLSGTAIGNYGNLYLVNATVSHNRGYGIVNFGYASSGNSIIARNLSATMTDVSGTFISHGTNLIGSATGGQGFSDGANGDKVGTSANPIDPRLGALRNNGGANSTRALLGASPAINSGNNCVSAQTNSGGCMPSPLTSDQRLSSESSRLIAGRVDIGAFESSYTNQPTDKEQCKNGGWQNFNNPQIFRNQGECIQFVNTGRFDGDTSNLGGGGGETGFPGF
jgi:hypothetical protein